MRMIDIMNNIGVIAGAAAAGVLIAWWGSADLVEWCVEAAALAFIGAGLGYSFDNLRTMVRPRRPSIARPFDDTDWHHQPNSVATEGIEIKRELKLKLGHVDLHSID